jgi:hypothetical protein
MNISGLTLVVDLVMHMMDGSLYPHPSLRPHLLMIQAMPPGDIILMHPRAVRGDAIPHRSLLVSLGVWDLPALGLMEELPMVGSNGGL